MKRALWVPLALILATGLALQAAAVGGVEDTVRETILRLKREQPARTLLSITPAQVAGLLNDEERRALGEQYLTFRVNVPVTVFVVTEPKWGEEAFWLGEQGFEETALEASVRERPRAVWRKDFAAGRIGLGVNSLSGQGEHYFAVIAPRGAGAVSVTEVAPAEHTLGTAREGEAALADEPDKVITALPAALEGQTLLRGCGRREREAQIAGLFRATEFPSSEWPDQIALTVTEDPATSMTVQWRTDTTVTTGMVRYQKKALVDRFDPEEPLEAAAETTTVEDIGLVGDDVVNRHSVTLTGLDPGARYLYSVGDDTGGHWSEYSEFSTAPAGEVGFSFLYMGDIQNGFDRWASLRRRAMQVCPDAAFCLTAGDQVNRGVNRDDWDGLFHYADGLFARVPWAPAVGNHETYGGVPRLYLELLNLPRNGPAGITPERAYAFEYGQVLVVSLDANLPPAEQAEWLERRLASSDAVWKFALFHQPAYSSAPRRDNPQVREIWGPLFEKYGVNVVFQGHDHGYLRTYPMKGGQRVEAGEGPVYLVTVAGTKLYEVDGRDYSAFTMARTSTFQVIDVLVNPDRLVYRAYDVDGNKLDEFALQK